MGHQQSVQGSPATRVVETETDTEELKTGTEKTEDGNRADEDVEKARSDEVRNGTGDSDAPLITGWPFYLLVAAVTLAVLLIAFNTTALGTAIPAITAEFNTVDDVGWYSAANLIANCVMVPFVGRLYRTFRIKVMFITFIAIFEIGALIAALSTSSMMLVISRAITGIGGSGILNGGSTIIASTVPIARRSFLNGVILSFYAVGQTAGPLIGGALTQGITWRWCFYINLPFGGLIIFLFLFVIKLPVTRLSEERTPLLDRILDIDYVGFVTFAGAALMILIGLQWAGTEFPWNSPTIIGLLCGGVVTFVLLWIWFGYKGDAALLPPRLLRDRINIMITITGFLQSGGSINSLYWLPIWFQSVKGASALESGILLLPLIISQLIASLVCGALVQKTGYYLPEVIGGNALIAIGAGLTSTFSPSISLGKIIGYQIFMGAGRGFIIQLLVTAMQANVPKEDASLATGYATFSQLCGGAIFSAVAKTIFTSSIPKALAKYAPDIDPSLLINTGATEISKAVPPDQVQGALLAYNEAITNIFYLQLAAAGCAFLSGWGMGWRNLKTIKQERENENEKTGVKEPKQGEAAQGSS
ncbi:hypothetical protein M426DRAFT_322417 [Hypoxylon sp. CI-4A]|nr:hypothetical protein M426DRAFT_322417 [Hypoxylon sp. CI-4A]